MHATCAPVYKRFAVVDSLFVVAPRHSLCFYVSGPCLCDVVLGVLSGITITLLRERKLDALLCVFAVMQVPMFSFSSSRCYGLVCGL